MKAVVLQQIYVINLLRRRDKRTAIEHSLHQSRISSYSIMTAMDGSHDYDSLETLVKDCQGIVAFQPSIFREEHVTNTRRYRAKLGCWFSHWKILFSYCSSCSSCPSCPPRNEWIVILEDDVEIQYDTATLLAFMEKTIQKHENPDIIVLGNRIGIAGQNIDWNSQRSYSSTKNSNYGCESYAVAVHAIPKFIPYLHLSHVQRKCSIDNRLADLNQGIIKIVPLEGPPFTICNDPQSKNSDIEI